MLGYIAILMILHSGFSTLRWRKYVQANQEPFFFPPDVLHSYLDRYRTLYCSATSLCSYPCECPQIQAFEIVHPNEEVAVAVVSYDSSFSRPNFRNCRTSRVLLLKEYALKRMGEDCLSQKW